MQVNHRFVLQKCRDICPQGRILDYGCGSGTVVEAGRRDGLDIHGVEAFHGVGDREKVQENGLLGVAIKELDNNRIPHPDNSFDLVVSNQVFEHVEDLELVLQEIRRVLKPSGKLFCLFPSKDVLREGHCGVPLAHWFSRSSRVRYYWLLFFRSLGLGYHTSGKARTAWTRDFADYLDRFTFYRSYDEIQKTFLQTFSSFQRLEHDYVSYRLQDKKWGLAAKLFERAPLTGLSRFVCRKLGGLVIVSSP